MPPALPVWYTSCRNPFPSTARIANNVAGGPLNDYFISVILGIVEGLTEFLPVSSTAHLRLAEALLHISMSRGFLEKYPIVIQLGAILCLPVYFRVRIADLVRSFRRRLDGQRSVLNHPLTFVAIAFV